MSTVKLTQSISETYPGSSLTGAVIVTLKADDVTKAASYAANISGFTIDAGSSVLPLGDGEFMVHGNATQPIQSDHVVAVERNHKYQLNAPGSSIQ
ncbi:MAG: hypothetical protein Q8T09_02895 [Candidatus Melainabacteria bacterium]|nr:hypothetical protein [Candidatus Melainabacteria bacterium]